MVQVIEQKGDFFGRLGSGFGKGMAEQLPKEIERSRLTAGLKKLGEQKDLSPFERFTGLVSAAHEYPQIVQSGSELLKQEANRNSFNRGKENEPTGSAKPYKNAIDVNFLNMKPSTKKQGGESIPSDYASRTEEANDQQGIRKENPTQEKYVPAIPWTPQQRDDDIGRESRLHPDLPFEEIVRRSADNERRFLESPQAYQAQDNYLKGQQDKAIEELDSRLATSLQKEGKDIYQDLSGTNKLNLQKAMLNDLATDPSLTPEKAAEKWEKIGKDFVVAKNEVKQKAHRDIYDSLSPAKKEEVLKSLKSAQKIYDQMGAKDEFYNMLRTKNNAATGDWGFGLSPGYAAMIAYPRSPGLKDIINKNPLSASVDFRTGTPKSRKIAEEFAKSRTAGDSILGFARAMKDKYSFFDESAFFDQLRENQDQYKFTADQEKELITGVSDIFRNWGDYALFPYFGRSVAHE